MDDVNIKVTDNRIFDDDGELREEYRFLDSESSPPAEAARGPRRGPVASPGVGAPDAATAGARPSPRPAAASNHPRFLELVAVLAEPIALFLGDARLPDGQTMEDLERARHYIDLLSVLQEKTRGNLGAAEAATLEDLLYRLRLRYVEKAG
jgi:hypothetical protein